MSVYLPSHGDPLTVTPETAGWTYAGLEIVRLEPGVGHELHTGDAEDFVLPLQGSVAVDVDESAGGDFQLTGRDSVFTGPSDFCYLGRDTAARLVSTSGVLAGPGPTRSMAFCDDPAHAWVRDSWKSTLQTVTGSLSANATRLMDERKGPSAPGGQDDRKGLPPV